MKKQSIILIASFLLCVSGNDAISQTKGHFVIDANTIYVFGTNDTNNPSGLTYEIETGVSYDLSSKLRIGGGFGGFRSVCSYNINNKQKETSNGPCLWVTTEYLLLPQNKIIRPILFAGIGYRFIIPAKTEEIRYEQYPEPGIKDYRFIPVINNNGIRSYTTQQNSIDGIYLKLGIAADIKIGECILNLSMFGELTQYYTGAFAKETGERYGRLERIAIDPPKDKNGKDRIQGRIDVFKPGNKPFMQTIRVATGLSIKVLLP